MNEDSHFNNTREPNGVKNHPNRKQTTTYKYNDNKGNRYSPSASYNYNGQSRGSNNFQQPRRRAERYKKESGGSGANDKLIKQNDTIIRLLKEIRDKIVSLTNTTQNLQNENIGQALNNDLQEVSNENKPVTSDETSEPITEESVKIPPLSDSPEINDTVKNSESTDDISAKESQPEAPSYTDQHDENSKNKPLKKTSSKL